MNPGEGHDIMVLGASSGGVEALRTVAAGLPSDLPAVVCAVLHSSPDRPSTLPWLLERAGTLPAQFAVDGDEPAAGRIYIAPPDRHLFFHDGSFRLSHGPRENGRRPAIDSLFRSAARIYDGRVVGVVLSGNLDDGSAGLQAIQESGGLTVVQDPKDARYRSMPENALRAVKADYVAPVAEIGPLLGRLARKAAGTRPTVVRELIDPLLREELVGIETLDRLGERTAFTCPECNGTLWRVHEGNLVRYHCHVGHAYSPESFLAAHDGAVEAALWAAVRSLEESAALHRGLAERAAGGGREKSERYFEKQALAAERNARMVRDLLQRAGPGEKTDE